MTSRSAERGRPPRTWRMGRRLSPCFLGGRSPSSWTNARASFNFNEMVSGPRSLPQNFRFLARRPPLTEIRSNVRLLRRKAEHLVLAGPFGCTLRWRTLMAFAANDWGTWRDGAVV